MKTNTTRGALAMGLGLMLCVQASCESSGTQNDETGADGGGGGAGAGGAGATGGSGGGGSPVMAVAPDGHVFLRHSEQFEYGGIQSAGLARAQFYQTISPFESGLDMPTGPEDCGVTVYTGSPPGMQLADYAYESAGTLSIAGAAGSWNLEPKQSGDEIYYSTELAPGTELQLGAAYDVSATGGDFPAFDAPKGLPMPPEMQLTSPALGDPFSLGGDFTVTWSGGDPATEVWLFLLVDGPNEQRGQLICLADNDGSFTMPAELVDQLPSGDATFRLQQVVKHLVDIEQRTISLTGIISKKTTGGVKP